MNYPLIGTLASFAIFVAGLIYHAGAMGQRVKALEEWRQELRADMKGINDKLDDINALIRGDKV